MSFFSFHLPIIILEALLFSVFYLISKKYRKTGALVFLSFSILSLIFIYVGSMVFMGMHLAKCVGIPDGEACATATATAAAGEMPLLGLIWIISSVTGFIMFKKPKISTAD